MKKFLYGIIIVAAISSCSTAKKMQKPQPPVANAVTPEVKPEVETVEAVLAKLNHINYTTFTGKMDVDYTSDGKKTSLDAKVQMYKDSLIWISLTGPLGIEGARAIVTKDSVKVINKLQKEYILNSIAYLQEKTGLPLDMKTMQDLLVGNPVFINNANSSYEKNTNGLLITSSSEQFKNLLTVLLPGYLPSLSMLEDVKSGSARSAELRYGNYVLNNNINFPTLRDIKTAYKKEIEIQLNYKSYKFDQQLNTPFSIPGNYTRTL